MDRPAQLHLPLDIDDLAPAQAHPRTDPRRLAETHGAKRHDRQAIDLPHLGTVGGDQHQPALDHFVGAVADPLAAVPLRRQRLFHLLQAHGIALALLGDVVGLPHHIGDGGDAHRQLARIVGQPRGMFDDPLHRIALEWPHIFPPRDGAHQPREGDHGLRLPRHVVLEIGRHLEEFAEIRIVLRELIVKLPVAHQHDADIQRHWLADPASPSSPAYTSGPATRYGFPGRGWRASMLHRRGAGSAACAHPRSDNRHWPYAAHRP